MKVVAAHKQQQQQYVSSTSSVSPSSRSHRSLCCILVVLTILIVLHFSGTQSFFNEITFHSPSDDDNDDGFLHSSSSSDPADPFVRGCRSLRAPIGTCNVFCSRRSSSSSAAAAANKKGGLILPRASLSFSSLSSRRKKSSSSVSSNSSSSSSSPSSSYHLQSNKKIMPSAEDSSIASSSTSTSPHSLDFLDGNDVVTTSSHLFADLAPPVEFERQQDGGPYLCFEGCRCPAPSCIVEEIPSATVAAMAATQSKFALSRARSTRRLKDRRVFACVDSPSYHPSAIASTNMKNNVWEDELVCVGSEIGDKIPDALTPASRTAYTSQQRQRQSPSHLDFLDSSNTDEGQALARARAEMQRFKRATSFAFRRWFDWGERIPYGGPRRGTNSVLEQQNQALQREMLRKQGEDDDAEEKQLLMSISAADRKASNNNNKMKKGDDGASRKKKMMKTDDSVGERVADGKYQQEQDEEDASSVAETLEDRIRQLRRRRAERDRQQRLVSNDRLPRFVKPDNGGRASGAHSPLDGLYRLHNTCFRSEGAPSVSGFFGRDAARDDAAAVVAAAMQEFQGSPEYQPMAGSHLRMKEVQSYVSGSHTTTTTSSSSSAGRQSTTKTRTTIEMLNKPPELVLDMHVLLQPVEYLSESPQHFLYRAVAARNIAHSLWGVNAKYHVVYVLLPSSYLDFSAEEEHERTLKNERVEQEDESEQLKRLIEQNRNSGIKRSISLGADNINNNNSSNNATATTTATINRRRQVVDSDSADQAEQKDEDDEEEAAAVKNALQQMRRIHQRAELNNAKLRGVFSSRSGDNNSSSSRKKSDSSGSPLKKSEQDHDLDADANEQEENEDDDSHPIVAALEGPKRFYQLIGQSWSAIIVPKQRKRRSSRLFHLPSLRLRRALYEPDLPYSPEELAREIEQQHQSIPPLACFKEVVVSQVCLGKCIARNKIGNQFQLPMFLPRTSQHSAMIQRLRREMEICVHKEPRSTANGFFPTVTIMLSPRDIYHQNHHNHHSSSSSSSSSSPTATFQSPIDFGFSTIVPAVRQELLAMKLKEGRFSKLNVVTLRSHTPKELLHILIDTDMLIGSTLTASTLLAFGWLMPRNAVIVELVSPRRLLPFPVAALSSSSSSSSFSASQYQTLLLQQQQQQLSDKGGARRKQTAAASSQRIRLATTATKRFVSSSTAAATNTTTTTSTDLLSSLPPQKFRHCGVSSSRENEICRYTKSGWNKYVSCDIGGNADAAAIQHLVLVLPMSSVSDVSVVRAALDRQWQQLEWRSNRNQVGSALSSSAASTRRQRRATERRGQQQQQPDDVVDDDDTRMKIMQQLYSASQGAVGGGDDALPSRDQDEMIEKMKMMPLGITAGPELFSQLIRVGLCRLIVYTRHAPGGDPIRISTKRGKGGEVRTVIYASKSSSNDPVTVMCRRLQNRRVTWNFTAWKFGFDD